MERETCRIRAIGLVWAALLFFVACLLPSTLIAGEEADNPCLDCHDDMAQTLVNTPHDVINRPNQKVQINCQSCHGPGVAHLEDPSVDNIDNPAKMSSAALFDRCSSCHPAHVGFNDFGFEAHFGGQVSCVECHKVHENSDFLLRDRSGLFCLNCHEEKKDELFESYSHPVLDNGPSCLNCHATNTQSEERLVFDLNQVCVDCHPQESGPHMYEHEPVNAYSTEGSGCMECHQPHGGPNSRLTTQEGSELCMRCHVPPPRHKDAHGGWFAGYSCMTCHTDIHGSFSSNLFLDENLPSRIDIGMGSCFQSGCHSLNK